MASTRWAIGFVGALIGLVALLAPWAVISTSGLVSASVELTPYDVTREMLGGDSGSGGSGDLPLPEDTRLGIMISVAGLAIFIIGCLAALGHPGGGFGQLAGAGIFYFGSTMWGGTWGLVQTVSIGIGYGMLLGGFGGLVAVLGLAVRKQPRAFYQLDGTGAPTGAVWVDSLPEQAPRQKSRLERVVNWVAVAVFMLIFLGGVFLFLWGGFFPFLP